MSNNNSAPGDVAGGTMERTAEEWGRVAVDLPGWQWMPGMCDTTGARVVSAHYGSEGWSLDIAGYWAGDDDTYPDPDDHATAGCILALLGGDVEVCVFPDHVVIAIPSRGIDVWARTLARACIAAAEMAGRWPGASE